MKKSHIALLVAACLLGGTLMLRNSFGQSQPASPPPAATKIAVCDVQEVFANYERAKDLLSKLNDERQAAAAESDKRGKAMEALQTEMSALKPGSPEYDSRLAQLERMAIDRKVEIQYQESALQRKHRAMTLEMYNEVMAMISTVAGAEGIHLVFQRDKELLDTGETADVLAQIRNRKVLHCDGSLDITQTVLARLNETFHSSGAK